MRFYTAIPAALVILMTGCGGGGGGGGDKGPIIAPPAPTPTPEENVAAITVGRGTHGILNLPTVSVTVCAPNDASRCATIENVLVDTGSVGLRLVSSSVAAVAPNLVLPAERSNAGSAFYQCVGFLDGSYAWGGVRRADVKIGGKSAANIPIQLIGDVPASGARPEQCTGNDPSFDISVAANLGANGILGVNYWVQDCGLDCEDSANFQVFPYFTCGPNSCSPTGIPVASQVRNPVSAFVGDNGVIVELPALPPSGSASATGSLIFGINTRSNNALGNAQVFNGEELDTFYKGAWYVSFVDSGSNALYFDDATLPRCDNSIFFCPAATQQLSALLQDRVGNSRTVEFSVASLEDLPRTSFALNNVAGLFAFDDLTPTSSYFDWGLPFFFGRRVYFGLEGGNYPNAIAF
jgi:hypothetical protein